MGLLNSLGRFALLPVLAAGPRIGTGQIATDGTRGPALRLAGPDFVIPDSLGTAVGENLFHSFQTFSLDAGESAEFTGPGSITRVFSRVTGGNPSNINGTLRSTLPNADFYFINPAGVAFGPAARVDVPKAFTVTTADQIRFRDGGRFDARDPAGDVLTVAPPEAFGFLEPGAGRVLGGVKFDGSRIGTRPGNSMTVVAGGVTLRAGAEVKAPGAKLQVAAAGGSGTMEVEGLNPTGMESLGDIEIAGDSALSSSSDTGGGRLVVRAKNLRLLGEDPGVGSGLFNNTRKSGSGGTSEIEVTETFTLADGSGIFSSATGSGNGGDVEIRAERMEMEDADINLWTGLPPSPDFPDGVEGNGDGGNLHLAVNELVMSRESSLSANTAGSGRGGDLSILEKEPGAGKIEIRADSDSPFNTTYISSATYGSGNAGAIRIQAESLKLEGISGVAQITSDANIGSSGSAGEIAITAKKVDVGTYSVIGSRTFGSGRAGNVLFRGVDSLALTGEGSSISAVNMGFFAGADAGNIDIEARDIRIFGYFEDLFQSAGISSSSFGLGKAGRILLKAADSLSLVNGGNVTSSGSGEADGGDIQIEASRVTIAGGYFDSTAFGQGAGGKIDIHCQELLVTDYDGLPGLITARVVPNSSGNGGDIKIEADDVIVQQGGTISSSTFGRGAGGRISLVTRNLRLEGLFSQLSVENLGGQGGGAGGDIVIDAAKVEVADFAAITSSTTSDSQGGRIDIQAGSVKLDEFADILSVSSGDGDGGAVAMKAGSISIRNRSEVTSDARKAGNAGSVELVARTGSIELSDYGRIRSAAVDGVAGSVTLEAGDRLRLTGGSLISVRSENNNAGTANLLAPHYILVRDSEVTAEAGIDGGNITIDPEIFGLENSTLNANAKSGNGGHIEIDSDFFYQLGPSSITAISRNPMAQPGTISIRSGVDFAGSLVGLPGELLSGETELRQGCARRNPRANSFALRGKGGVSPRPDSLFLIYSPLP